MSNPIREEVYRAARETAVVVDRSTLGMLQISGATRLDLIDRMSTQAVKKLKSGEGLATVLTTDIGRTIDRLILYTSSDTVYAMTGEGHNDLIARYFMRYVFFTDDFQLQDLTDNTVVFGVYGPNAGEKLQAVGFPEVDLSLHHWRQEEIEGMTAYIHRTDPIGGDGYFVIGYTPDKEKLWNHLLATGLVAANEAEFELLRIENGRPRFGHEMSLDYIPLETGLWDDISFNKGCYIGQEIIARMESRGKLAKQLVTLTANSELTVGAEILADGRKVGNITSAAVGPDGAVALGYVKTKALESGNLAVGETAVTIVK